MTLVKLQKTPFSVLYIQESFAHCFGKAVYVISTFFFREAVITHEIHKSFINSCMVIQCKLMTIVQPAIYRENK